jgi:hypothetical protein
MAEEEKKVIFETETGIKFKLYCPILKKKCIGDKCAWFMTESETKGFIGGTCIINRIASCLTTMVIEKSED